MKETEDLSNLSIEELIEKKKKSKSVFFSIAIAMAIICSALIYFAIKGKNYALIAVGIGSAISLLPAYAALTEIDKEIKKRSESDLLK